MKQTDVSSGVSRSLLQLVKDVSRPPRFFVARKRHQLLRGPSAVRVLMFFRSKALLGIALPFMRSPSSALGSYLREMLDPNFVRTIQPGALRAMYADAQGIFGERYLVNVSDHISWNLFTKGYFDLTPIALGLLCEKIAPGGTFIDVGANIGSSSLSLAKAGIPVVAIEASPSVAAELANNVRLNGAIPFSVINVAVTSDERAGQSSYGKIYAPPGNFGAWSLFEGWADAVEADRREELCRLTTLDSLTQGLRIEKISAIKMDIEGSEYDAISGMQETLARHKPPVTFEWRPDVALKANIQPKNPISLFPSDYEFFGVKATLQAGSIALELSEFSQQGRYENVLAVPNSAPWRAMAAARITVVSPR